MKLTMMASERPASGAAKARLRTLASLLAMALFIATGSVSGPPRAHAAALYGLTVGVDDYVGVANDLEGAVHDAKDIAKALRSAGAAEVVTLLDRKASKKAIEAAWNAMVAKASAGDTIVFSYAGHGSQEDEPAGRGDEKDGKNENFLLAGYQVKGPGTLERIVDDEIFLWLKRAEDKKIRVIFVADSCHSGTMHRSARAEGVKFRSGDFGKLIEDRLVLPLADASKLSEDDFENITFVGATTEDQLTPEVSIQGEKRGALSWALARAIEGRADFNGNGEVTQLELLGFVVNAVHAHVESQQTPQIRPLRARSEALYSVRGLARTDKTESKRSSDTEALKVMVDGGDASVLSGTPSIKVVASKSDADLIWYAKSGKVDHVIGGTVAENVTAKELPAVAVKWAALKWLKARAALSPVKASLPQGNDRYLKGKTVEVVIAGARYPRLTLFNLPPDGRVEFFIPDPQRKGEATKDWRGTSLKETFKVADPPYGAEHLVAIFSSATLKDLHAALRTMKTADSAAALLTILEEALKGQEFDIGVLDIYTGSGK